MRRPIQFCSVGNYRRFTSRGWNELLCYITGLSLYEMEWKFTIGMPGWCHDLYTYWHRARYGWAPRDTWNLNNYLNRVFAGSLHYLADHSHGCPAAYVDESAKDHECDKWEAELRRWARAFSEDPQDVNIYDRETDYAQHIAEEARRREQIQTALKEIAPVWENLWD